MKKWMKVLSITVAMAALATTFAACSKKDEPSASNVSQPEKVSYVVLTEDLGAEQYGIGFRKGDIALGLEVQKILDEMIADGKAAEISKTWFNEDILIKDAKNLKETAADAGDKSLETLKAKGKFILGLDDSFPPMGYRDDQNNIVGFDIDLAKEVATRMGVELVLQPIDWDAKELELSSGAIDCIWNGMSITDERVAAMFFAKPYIANKQIVIVPSNSEIKTIADLEGKKIGLQKGSTALNALKANPISEKVAEISEYPENVSAFMDLKAGRVDAFVVDEVVGRYIIANDAK